MMLFSKRIILLGEEEGSQVAALSKLTAALYKAQVVNEHYQQAILDREEHFPTGLMTQSGGVAIPHADANNVITPQIAFMQLKKPVMFHQMGDNKEIAVDLIFMLALKKAKNQLTMLQTLMTLFQKKDVMEHLRTVTTQEAFLELMKENQLID